jgi:hypothetical protein
MGLSWLKNIAKVADEAIAAGRVITVLFPDTKKASRYLDTAEKAEGIAGAVVDLFAPVPIQEAEIAASFTLSLQSILSIAEINGVMLTREEAGKILNYLIRTVTDQFNLALGAIRNQHGQK